MGDVVNRAAKLASQGNKGWRPALMVDNDFYSNLNEDNRKLLRYDSILGWYTGDVVSIAMNEWHKENCP